MHLCVSGIDCGDSRFGGFLLFGWVVFYLFNVGCLVVGLLVLLDASCGGDGFRVAVLVSKCLGVCCW